MPGAGKAWEMQLARWHRAYWVQRLALVWRNHPEYKLVGGRWRPAGKGMPDFSGALPGGRVLAFDAKETQHRLPFSAVKAHQASALDQVLEIGGLAFIAARFVITGRDVVLPWGACRTAYYETTGLRSWAPGDGVDMSNQGWIDWAEGM